MAKIKMDWDWVGDYPIFIYTKFIDHGLFEVKIVCGVKGNQNTGNISYSSPPLIEYTETRFSSRNSVVTEALRKTAIELLKGDHKVLNKTTAKAVLSQPKPSMIQPKKPIPSDASGTPPWNTATVKIVTFKDWFDGCDYPESMKEILEIGWEAAIKYKSLR